MQEGECALHHCDNPPCVNFDHLYAGNRDDNAKDRVARHRQARGERHGQAKLKDSDIPVIRELIEQGVTYTELQKTYPVAAGTFTYIKQRKTYQHIN